MGAPDNFFRVSLDKFGHVSQYVSQLSEIRFYRSNVKFFPKYLFFLRFLKQNKVTLRGPLKAQVERISLVNGQKLLFLASILVRLKQQGTANDNAVIRTICTISLAVLFVISILVMLIIDVKCVGYCITHHITRS